MGERGVPRGIFGVCNFGQKGFFWVNEIYTHQGFLGHEKTQGFFWYFTLHSTQMNSNISTIYCWCGIFWVC